MSGFELTTGQMLDKLGLEDTAINRDGYRVGYGHKGDLLMWPAHEEKPQTPESNMFGIYFPWVQRDRWGILK